MYERFSSPITVVPIQDRRGEDTAFNTAVPEEVTILRPQSDHQVTLVGATDHGVLQHQGGTLDQPAQADLPPDLSVGEVDAVEIVIIAANQDSPTAYSTVQYSAVQYSASAVQYSTVQNRTVQYSTVQYRTVQYSTLYESSENTIIVKIKSEIQFDLLNQT